MIAPGWHGGRSQRAGHRHEADVLAIVPVITACWRVPLGKTRSAAKRKLRRGGDVAFRAAWREGLM